jgi:hypothetical protein
MLLRVEAAHSGVEVIAMVAVVVTEMAVALVVDMDNRLRGQFAKSVKRSAIAPVDAGKYLIVSSSWRRNRLIAP